MNRYILIALLGLATGLLGEEIGVRFITFLPTDFFLNDLLMVPLVIAVTIMPFILATSILVFKFQGFLSYAKGFIFSFAYYLPFQYKEIWSTLRYVSEKPFEVLSGAILLTVLGALFLSGIYYIVIKWKNRLKRAET